MNKLTAEIARMDIGHLREHQANPHVGLSMREEKYLAALEIALPVLEQQGEIAKPIECPFPCGWKELLRLAMNNGAFLAQNLIEGEEVKDIHRHAAFNNTEYLVSVIGAILKNQPQPATHQIDNDGWIEWCGGDCPVGVHDDVEVKFRDGVIEDGLGNHFVWGDHNGIDPDGDIIAYRVIENDGRE